MGRRVLIAGASGALGREVVLACKRRGHHVTALARQPRRLDGLPIDRVHQGDALQPLSLNGCCDGVDVLFSCLGASVSPSLGKGWRTFSAVDTPANLNLLQIAQQAKVGRLVYVSLFGGPDLRQLDYANAHEQVVDALRRSGLACSVMRPVGFFSALAELQDLAARGWLPQIGDGTARTNPIHHADLAAACVEAIESDDAQQDWPIGGPQTLSRHEIGKLACQSLGKPVRIVAVPPLLLRTNALLLRPFHRRLSHAIEFFATVSTHDAIAPAYGTRTLAEFFAARAGSAKAG